MATERLGQMVNLPAANDEITGRVIVQSIWAEGAATLVSGTTTVWKPTAAGQWINFPNGVQFDGLKKTVGTANLFIYLR